MDVPVTYLLLYQLIIV